ncbi:MAG TPA: phospholipase D family protein [Tepidisphaeraceae bacterium]|nr:phospholipase D family protein [Tepidisphaeraceae bacterium]
MAQPSDRPVNDCNNAPPDGVGTRLDRSVAPLVQAHPGLSGILALPDGRDAFAARVLMSDAAERTLDARYYIWHDDLSGGLLFAALRRAADRGVRVRLLLDDNNTVGLDSLLAALNAHPNIEVRLFNPFRFRRWRILGYLTDFARLNRRMHNKSFTVDNQATIVGGRNVGDEYFDAGQGVSFADLDVLAVGPVVAEVAGDFERYWTSRSSCPAERVLPPVDEASVADLEAAASRAERAPGARAYMQALASSAFVQTLLAGQLPLEWAAAHMVSDDPTKVLGRLPDDALMWSRLKRILGVPTQELELVSPYFVPGWAGEKFLDTLARRGVTTTVLTNSLEATDVPAVHAGYARWRKPLLMAGVRLFEMKREFSSPPVRAHGRSGSSNSSLHAKTFSVDRARVFIGSFNFDPRSARLNTEMGLVIESPALAQAMADSLARHLRSRAYEVRLRKSGRLQWLEQRDGHEVIHTEEPGTGVWRRAFVRVLSVLPIEWLL